MTIASLINFIPGHANSTGVTIGANTPAPYGNATVNGAKDGSGPADATKNMAEIYNRLFFDYLHKLETAGIPFDPANWAQGTQAIQTLIANAIAGVAPDKFAVGWSAYNAATNTLSLLMADGSTLPVDLTPAFADVIATHEAAADPHTQYVKKAGDTMTGNLLFSNGASPLWGTANDRMQPNGTIPFFTDCNALPPISGDYHIFPSPATLNLPPWFGSSASAQGLITQVGHSNGFFATNNIQIAYSFLGLEPGYRCIGITGVTGYTPWKRLGASLGADQSWVDETGNRVAGVLYTNTTQKPMVVLLSLLSNAYGDVFKFEVNAQTVAQSTSFPGTLQPSYVVPIGATYQFNLTNTSGTASMQRWAELKG